jgi:hypothetical protein
MRRVFAVVGLNCLLSVIPSFAETVCTINQPTAFPSKQVSLSVVHTGPDAGPFHWTLTGGHLQVRDQQTVWLTRGMKEGAYTAVAVSASQPEDRCSVRLFIIEPTRGARATARGLLVRGRKEDSGYGLYSYLLFGAVPEEKDRQRYLESIRTYLRLSPRLQELANLIEHEQLNLNYVPITVAPLGKPNAEWILEHYDYARAAAILHSVPGGPYLRGPYVLSGKLQGENNSISAPTIFQDLSTVPTELVSKWYEHFLNQAAQENLSSSDRLHELVLKMRTLIAVAAAGVPDVQKSLESWLKWTAQKAD